jgi:hypothetical protein
MNVFGFWKGAEIAQQLGLTGQQPDRRQFDGALNPAVQSNT